MRSIRGADWGIEAPLSIDVKVRWGMLTKPTQRHRQTARDQASAQTRDRQILSKGCS
jgi:hypothetical protein